MRIRIRNHLEKFIHFFTKGVRLMKQENVFNDSPEDMNFEILSAIE